MSICHKVLSSTKEHIKMIDLIPNHQGTCLLLKNIFDEKYCQQLLEKANQTGFNVASDKYPTNYRNNERLQVDDMLLAKRLFSKCAEYIPKTLDIDGNKMLLDGLNSRLRYCKYSKNQSFSIHQDGVYHRDNHHRSVLTFLLYLNDSDDYVGGRTSFYVDQYGKELLTSYKPCIGDVLVFSHNIWHSGDLVTKNSKYILRSDFMYKQLSNNKVKLNKKKAVSKHHDGYIWKIIQLNNGLLATSSRDKSIKIWNKNLELKQVLQIHHNSVLDMSINDHGDIYAVSRDGYMSKWTTSGNEYHLDYCIETGHPCTLSVLVLKSGKIVTTGSDNNIRLWSENGNKVACSIKCHDWNWQVLEYIDNKLISCSADGSISVWNLDDLLLIKSVNIGKGSVRCMSYHKDNLCVGFESGYIGVIDLFSLELLGVWKVHDAAVRDLLSVGDLLYSCGEDNKVCLSSDLKNKNHSLYSHGSFVTSLAVSGSILYSVSYDGYIRLRKRALIS